MQEPPFEIPERLLDPVGLAVAMARWFDVCYTGISPDMEDEMLDVNTGITWFSRSDYTDNTVRLHRKTKDETRVFKLSKEFFDNLCSVKMPEIRYVPAEGKEKAHYISV